MYILTDTNLFKVNNGNTRTSSENMFKANNKDTRTTPPTFGLNTESSVRMRQASFCCLYC